MLIPALLILVSCSNAPSETTPSYAEDRDAALIAEVQSRNLTDQPEEELLAVAQSLCDSYSTSDPLYLGDVSDWDYGSSYDAIADLIKRFYCSDETKPTSASGTDRSSSTTTPSPTVERNASPPSVDEMEQISVEMRELIAPCTEVTTMLTLECTKAAFYSVQELEKLQGRLTSDYPETRVAVMELIAKLEYWSDNCISSEANSPERRACISHMLVPAEYGGVEVAYYEDIQG